MLTFGLKMRMRIVSLLVLFMVSGFATVPALAHHTDSPDPCFDITDQGTGVLIGGAPNSGKVVFDPDPGPNPAHNYEACVTDPGSDSLGMFDVKGWAWDDNLGWVSFFCDASGNNLGLSCGSIPYGVTMEGTDQPNPGRLHGCAWSDNIGWISFNNSDPASQCGGSAITYYVQAEADDGACLGEVDAGGCPNNGAVSTYAWADSVGWLDFTGVKFPWVELISAAVSVTFEITPDPATVNKATAPIADGSNTDGTPSYEMRLYFKDINGNPVNVGAAPYTVQIQVTWEEDTVKKDQTTLTIADFTTCKNDVSGGSCAGSAVDKPMGSTHFTWDAGLSAYKAPITSVAPTSGLNGYDKDGNKTVDYSYETFDLGNPNGVNNVQQNNLKLSDVRVSILNTATTICAFGEAGCTPKSLATGTRTLQFRPGVEVTQFSQNNQDFLQGYNTVANSVATTTVCLLGSACSSAHIDFITGIGLPFLMVVPDSDGDPAPTDADSKDLMNYSSFGSTNLLWTPICTEETCGEFGNNPYVYSVVDSTVVGKTVRYFSNKLPRVKGTLVVNPVATISGSVYSTGVTNPQTGTIIRSLGDVSTNILRDTIFRNVSNIIAGATPPKQNPVTLKPNNGGFAGGGTPLLYDSNKVPKVYYFRDDVYLDNGASPITWSGDRTLIVIGGNVYINSDLYNVAVTPKPKLGIIALKDFTTGKGGNLYVAPQVKNIQANIFGDGSFFSYDGKPSGITPAGLPYFDSEDDRYNTLLNQLSLEGTLATQNTIGGAVKTPSPILGDGTVASPDEGQYGKEPSGRSAARLYDLNFLRYYGYVFERKGVATACPGDAVDQQNPTLCPSDVGYLLMAIPVGQGGDLVLNPGGDPAQGLTADQASAVYIQFDPPSPSLPGFSVTGGVNVEVKPQ